MMKKDLNFSTLFRLFLHTGTGFPNIPQIIGKKIKIEKNLLRSR